MSEDRVWKNWPTCRQCGRRRQTICPTCGVAGNQFLLAEYQVPGAPRRDTRNRQHEDSPSSEPASSVLLLCPRCDEAFSPRFYRLCPACGGDAGEGIRANEGTREPLSNRVLLVIYGLVGLTTLILLYFWFLFQHA
ncbi:MAG: hypothetical protein ACQESR_17300 [Planctomycetota bacterium]